MELSILFASGDQGVCGREGCGFLKHKFHPDFPAASPYITAVGGTDFETKGVIGAETAWTAGGGGFSDTFAIPDYQASAVAGYKSSSAANLPPQAWTRRAAATPTWRRSAAEEPLLHRLRRPLRGRRGRASCPVVAGVFARLNAIRLARGDKPMGFLNPWIYANPSGFQDVTSGINHAGYKYGFTAVAGWDAATGLGTPDLEKLAALV